jgi:hypothetical protein
MNRYSILTVVIAALLVAACRAQASVTVSPGSNTINAAVIYTIQLNLGNTGIAPGTATVTFNSGYTFTNSSALANCYDTVSPSTLYSCYASSSNAISLAWTAGMGTRLVFSISTISNPAYVDNYTVAFSFAPTSGATFQTVTTTINTLQPDALTSCSLSFAPTYATSASTLSVTLTNKNAILAGGSLQLTFAGYTPTYSSPSVSSASPYVSSVTPTPSGNVLFLSAVFTSAVPASTSITISISNVAAPPTTGSGLYSVTLLTSAKSSYLYKIDQGSCSITGITNYPTASLAITSDSSIKVGSSRTLFFV